MKWKAGEAEAILVQVMKEDPSNRTAPYYLDLIKEAQFMDRARKREAVAKTAVGFDVENDWIPSLPNRIPCRFQIRWPRRNLVYTSKGRQDILSKLDRIHLNEVQYDLPLTEVLKPPQDGVPKAAIPDGRRQSTF